MVLVICGLVYLLLGVPWAESKTAADVPAMRVNSFEQPFRRTVADFTDGLSDPSETKTYQLDETGAGMANQLIYYRDINGDGVSDKITRSRHENGTSHYWQEYVIELAYNGKYRNITPEHMRTTHGAECSLSQIQLSFSPKFQIVKISRPWQDSWDTPSVATRTVYELKDNKLVIVSQKKLKSVCDVTELFLAE